MAKCANCERALPDGQQGFCSDCSALFADMRTSEDQPTRGGVGSAIGGIVGALGGRAVGIGVIVAISAVSGGLCINSQRDVIEEQNRAAAGLSSAPAGERTGTKSIFELRVGDCFAEAPSGGEIESVLLVRCSDPRAQLRVVDLVRLPDQTGYPSDEYLDEQAALHCSAEATSSIVPSQETWEIGDRVITCLADE